MDGNGSSNNNQSSYLHIIQIADQLATIRLEGEKTLPVAMEIWGQVGALIKEHRLRQLLILDQMHNHLTLSQVLHIEESLQQTEFPREPRIAIVDEHRNEPNNLNAFGETVAFNRGWRNVRTFLTEKDALLWLNKTTLN